MSAILEEMIGFGGNSSQPAIPSSNVIKQKIASETPITSDDINALIDKTKSIPEVNIEVKTQPDGSFNIKSDLDEVNRHNPHYKSMKPNQQSIDESKKIMKNFQKGVANYPKHMSYEGSMVVCVMLSMKSPALVQMDCLPAVDQETINGWVKGLPITTTSYFYVEFDANKDFIVSFKQTEDSKTAGVLNMFNTVAHPRNDDLKDTGVGEVPVENDGDTIKVGNKIVVDKRVMRTIMKMPAKDSVPSSDVNEEEIIPKRQPVAGRNAYEIRADVLQMAIDWSVGTQSPAKPRSDDEVVSLAKKFYSFVENRR